MAKAAHKELRGEYMQMEGDPLVRAKLCQVRVERGRKRMVANVPHASVVITNPTHYAVALQYEAGMNAPVCLAKGVDTVARKSANWLSSTIFPLWRTRRSPGPCMPVSKSTRKFALEHYRAVAEVIGFVMRLKGRRGGRAN